MREAATNFVDFEDCFDLPNPGLRAYFFHVREGNADEYRTPFFKGKSLAEICNGWKPCVDDLKREWPGLLAYENDLLKKVGPLSVQKPLSERLSDIDSYYASITSEAKPISDMAKRAWLKEWADIKGIRLRGQDRTVTLMRKSTNSGAPFFAKRRLVLPKTLPVSEVTPSLQVIGPKRSAYGVCAVLGWRGQEGGPEPKDVKQRVIWMFPMAVNIEELRFYQPLIESCQRFELVPAWIGMDAVDRNVTKLFDTKGKKDLVIATDFTAFDQHFNPALQEAAYWGFSAIASGSLERNWLDKVFPIKFTIPLAYDWEKMRHGQHGMASGSGGTNADETVVHRMMQWEAAADRHAMLNPYSQCLGDDGIITYPGCTVDDVISTYTSHGLEMNPDKQGADTDELVYLRRWHHTKYRIDGLCRGVYSTYRALNRLAEQERWYEDWSREMVALRQLAILENCKYHPLREKFVDYCMEGDSYRLGLGIPGFMEHLAKYASKAIDNMPDFLGYSRSLDATSEDRGIENWWVVKYLKSKA